MKKKVYLAVVFTVCCILSGCGANGGQEIASNSNATESKPLLDANFKSHYNEILIGENEIALPCDFESLMEIGFSDADEDTAMIEKGKPSYLTLTKDNSSVKVHAAYKGREEQVPKEQAEIVSLLATKEDSEALNLSFYGGITFSSTEDEVKNILEFMESYDDGALYGIKIGDYSYFSVSFHGGVINDIMVVNGEEYFK